MRSAIRPALLVISVFGVVIALWWCIGLLPFQNRVPGVEFSTDGKPNPTLPGIFGDSFGWTNSLFSALAFAGVLLTLWMQRTELQLQRDEMQRTRKEMKTTREEHARTAGAQEKSANRLFLAAYMNALESLRKYSQWRMSANPAKNSEASYPVVEGLVVQARVSQSLQILIRDLEPEIREMHTALTAVTEQGSNVWLLEQLLGVHLNLRELLGSNKRRTDNELVFQEAVRIAELQLKHLDNLKAYCGPKRQNAISAAQVKAPDSNLALNPPPGDARGPEERRDDYFRRLEGMNKEILSSIMTICYE